MISVNGILSVAGLMAALATVPVSAQQAPATTGDGMAAANQFINSIVWPGNGKKIGFKSLELGSGINLDDRSVIAMYKSQKYVGAEIGLRPVDGVAIYCTPKVVVVGCELKFWNDADTRVPAVNELKTAFGEPVKVTFAAIPLRPIAGDVTPNGRFGQARIVEVTISTKNQSGAFLRAAIAHFTETMGSEPFRRQTFKDAKSMYSPACLARVKEIENKPIAQISVQDRADYERCGTEGAVNVMSGNLNKSREITYEWADAANNVNVVIFDQSENLAGLVTTETGTIRIGVDINKPMEEFGASMKRVAGDQRAKQDAARRSDF